jgi:HEPN domain-containing protein
MDNRAIIDYWVNTSDRDYKTMKNLFDSGDYHWCLFMGHLVLEKLFKALYVQTKGAEPPRIHDLVRLAEKCHLVMDDNRLDKLEMITRFNLSVRYPDFQQEFYKMCTKDFSLKAMSSIDEVRLWLKKLILKS